MSETLETIYIAKDPEIGQYIRSNNHQGTYGNHLEMRLIATIYRNNDGSLVSEDKFFVSDADFPRLYLLTDDELVNEATSMGIGMGPSSTRLDIIRGIITYIYSLTQDPIGLRVSSPTPSNPNMDYDEDLDRAIAMSLQSSGSLLRYKSSNPAAMQARPQNTEGVRVASQSRGSDNILKMSRSPRVDFRETSDDAEYARALQQSMTDEIISGQNTIRSGTNIYEANRQIGQLTQQQRSPSGYRLGGQSRVESPKNEIRSAMRDELERDYNISLYKDKINDYKKAQEAELIQLNPVNLDIDNINYKLDPLMVEYAGNQARLERFPENPRFLDNKNRLVSEINDLKSEKMRLEAIYKKHKDNVDNIQNSIDQLREKLVVLGEDGNSEPRQSSLHSSEAKRSSANRLSSGLLGSNQDARREIEDKLEAVEKLYQNNKIRLNMFPGNPRFIKANNELETEIQQLRRELD